MKVTIEVPDGNLNSCTSVFEDKAPRTAAARLGQLIAYGLMGVSPYIEGRLDAVMRNALETLIDDMDLQLDEIQEMFQSYGFIFERKPIKKVTP